MRAIAVLTLVLVLLLPATALAQRGTGEPRGLAAQGVQPDRFEVQGTIAAVQIKPCEATTGRSIMGVHVILAEDDGDTLNVHLGPQADLPELTSRLKAGEPFTATVFRTDRLAEDAAIATEVGVDGASYLLRDASLRPVWAGQPAPRPKSGRGRGWRNP